MAIASDLAVALDPVRLARQVGLEPDPWQAATLRTTSPRVLLNCSRQSGKSTVVALLAVHGSIYEPDTLTLLLSPSLRQSSELFRKCIAVYRAMGWPVEPESQTALTLMLGNGSRIVSLPGKEATVRGFSAVRRLIVDEAARVPNELYIAIRPMLAVSGGQLIALSTPFGRRGWWSDAWHSEEPWERQLVPATQCPRIGADFLAEEWRTLGEYFYRQEYDCVFLDPQTAAFRKEDIEGAFGEEVETWAL